MQKFTNIHALQKFVRDELQDPKRPNDGFKKNFALYGNPDKHVGLTGFFLIISSIMIGINFVMTFSYF